ncbi:hypothetical protein ACIQOW_03600 [Kitasatospora sp. NPDC091335]|uniref:hypothetical protein n=1 Tax=Kitasatospora sp. NPDC091335 TaxID=3364085 RepID=UPI00381B9145
MATARDALLAELLDGEDPAADHYTETRARLERMVDAYRDEELTSEAGERWIRSQENQLGIKWADFRAGRWEMDLAAGRDFAAAYVAAARALLGDAPNYSETKLMFDVKIAESPETYTLVVQRHTPGALTPHEARQQAEAETTRLRAELAAARTAALTEAADHLDRIADEVEARVAAYYGPASGIGPGSAGHVRMDAKEIRALAARTTTS